MNISLKKREGSPDFVIGSGGVKYEDLKAFVNSKGYVNFDLLKGKEDGFYIKISDFGIKKEENNAKVDDEVIPF